MPDDQDNEAKVPMLHHAVPIPTYEEAIGESSRTPSESASLLPSSRPPPRPPSGYQPPTVESVRSSVDSSFLSDFASARGSSIESLRREIIQMEVMDGGEEEGGGRGRGRRLRSSLTKRFSSFSSSLALRNPFRGVRWRWRWRWRLPPIPSVPCIDRISASALLPVYRLLAVVVALVVVYILLATDVLSFRHGPQEYMGPFDPESVRVYAERGIERERIEKWTEYMSSFDHVAGTEGDFVLAEYVRGQFSSFGMSTEKVQYDVYLNYPVPGGRRVWMDQPKWEAQLEEPRLKEAPGENTLAFHAHSKSGTAKGPVVYANFGSREDFRKLKEMGIEVKGAVVLMRYGGTLQRDPGFKIRAAQDRGAVGALLFSDPKAEGWDWPEDAVQRGSVSLSSLIPGDVLSPGWPSLPENDRISKVNNDALPKIPSLPLV